MLISLLWLVLAIILWGGLHSLLASLPVKAFARQAFGPGVDRGYRLAYNLFAGLSFLPVLAVAGLMPDHTVYSLPSPWSILLLGLELLALIVLVLGFLQSHPLSFLGLSQVAGIVDDQGKLTTNRLYHFVRHPLYTAGLVILWASPRVSAHSLVLSLFLSVYILIGARLEERKLIKEYGQEYLDYMAVTPMLVPFLKWNKSRGKTS